MCVAARGPMIWSAAIFESNVLTRMILTGTSFLTQTDRHPPSPERLAKKLDRDLWRTFLDRFLNFFGRLGQPVGVNVDSDATARTAHVFVGLESADGLMKILPAIGALKRDLMHLNARHQALPLSK